MDIHPNTDAVVVIDPEGSLHQFGNDRGEYSLASVTKILAALTFGEVVSDGFISYDTIIDDPIFSHGVVTFLDLLAHVSGINEQGDVSISPRTKRIYTTRAYDLVEQHLVSHIGESYSTMGELIGETLNPVLGTSFRIDGSCGSGGYGTLSDLVALAHELRAPQWVAPDVYSRITTAHCDTVSGVTPGWGHFSPNLWGAGCEIKGDKSPHWMGSRASSSSFGHFGQSGQFIFHDPHHNISIVQVSSHPFGPWAKESWPVLCDQIYDELL